MILVPAEQTSQRNVRNGLKTVRQEAEEKCDWHWTANCALMLSCPVFPVPSLRLEVANDVAAFSSQPGESLATRVASFLLAPATRIRTPIKESHADKIKVICGNPCGYRQSGTASF